MSKKVKVILIAIISFVIVIGILIGGFFMIFPMKPKVQIQSAQSRIKNNDSIIIASYNTASPWGNLLEGTYTTRRMHLWANQINNTLPDVLGVQELNSIWESNMKEFLPQYAYYGVKRGGDEKEQTSEMSGIFFLKDKFELIECDTFWISLTPEKESKFEGAACYRICSYVVLKNKSTGSLLAHFNTHLDHVSTEAQNLGGNLIAEKAEEIKSKYDKITTIITGDFNQFPDGLAIKVLEEKGFVKACDTTDNGNTNPTYHGWGKDFYEAPIDFIFVEKDVKIKSYMVHNEKWNNSYVSDHFMITAEIDV